MRAIRIAIISDIHGNIVALEAILKQFKTEKIDKIIVLGDLCNELPNGNEVIYQLKQVGAYAIKGNKEEYFLDYEKNQYKWENLQFKNIKFMYHMLTEENKEYIRNLPFDITLNVEGVTIKCVHGSPESICELVHQSDIEKIDKYTKQLQEDILVLGHTHEPIWMIEKNGKKVINAGCAGVSVFHIGQAEYVVLDIQKGNVHMETRLATYSLETLKNCILKSGMVENERTFINLVYLALNGRKEIRRAFYQTGREMMIAKGRNLYKSDTHGIYKTFKLLDDDIWRELTLQYEKYFLI